ncbi:hypothetical protein Poli38472_013297 [Pythium oligandrum]|uniref:Uncharacterized protein n=1 Tax=Pythium oligandrum TaxID=41045 RepID=A0A8K1C2S9_PYTOL|nr:hypothetical protein Poli38472_013297 [Pythium oligandrum]|eukprot:TMW55406.1 hypothetical protein Poli38472_013297 [Pythium oligandrum]
MAEYDDASATESEYYEEEENEDVVLIGSSSAPSKELSIAPSLVSSNGVQASKPTKETTGFHRPAARKSVVSSHMVRGLPTKEHTKHTQAHAADTSSPVSVDAFSAMLAQVRANAVPSKFSRAKASKQQPAQDTTTQQAPTNATDTSSTHGPSGFDGCPPPDTGDSSLLALSPSDAAGKAVEAKSTTTTTSCKHCSAQIQSSDPLAGGADACASCQPKLLGDLQPHESIQVAENGEEEPTCAVESSTNYVPEPPSTHTECRHALAEDGCAETKPQQVDDSVCIKSVDDQDHQPKRESEKQEPEGMTKVKKIDQVNLQDPVPLSPAEAALKGSSAEGEQGAKGDTAIPKETASVSPDLIAVESKQNTLNTTNMEAQAILQIVRYLVSKQTSAMWADHGRDHSVHIAIKRNNDRFRKERLSIVSKYANLRRQSVFFPLSLDERLQMRREQNALLEHAIECATIEIVGLSYLLRLCGSNLPPDVVDFVTRYSEERSSSTPGLAEFIPVITDKPTPVFTSEADEAASDAMLMSSEPIGIANVAIARICPSSTSLNTPMATGVTNTSKCRANGKKKKKARPPKCPKCRGHFCISVTKLLVPTDKMFCDCCVRLLPEERFTASEWESPGSRRCLECTGDLDEASTQELKKIKMIEVEIKHGQGLFPALRRAWMAVPTTGQIALEADHEVLQHPAFKTHQDRLIKSANHWHGMRMRYRELVANDSSAVMLKRDRALYYIYREARRKESDLWTARLELYSQLMSVIRFRLRQDLATERSHVMTQQAYELMAKQPSEDTRPTKRPQDAPEATLHASKRARVTALDCETVEQ